MRISAASISRATRPRGRVAVVTLLLGAAAVVAPLPPARADTVALVNALRTAGCARRLRTNALRPNAQLDAAARQLARSSKLPEAVESAGYSAAASASLHVKGPTSDEALGGELADHCATVSDARYSELGVYRRGADTWLVLAAPRPKAPVLEPPAVAERVLVLVNAARATPRKCGRERFAAAPPLKLSAKLVAAASAHARDMARRTRLGHDGSDGSQSSDRMTRAGYRWRLSGENVAAGQRDADAVVTDWLASPGHCANLMTPAFRDMGVAFALAPGANPDIYWAQEFGAPHD
jgi:uncharacterized protein YkwD